MCPVSIAGGEYAINGGAYTAVSGLVVNGDSVNVRLSASADYSITNKEVLTIGGVTDSFSATTIAEAVSSFQLPPQSTGNTSFSSEHFVGSNNCTMCHDTMSDNQGNDVGIIKDWSATMIANSLVTHSGWLRSEPS